MTRLLVALCAAVLLCAAYAAPPANAPAGTTGLCNDGTFYSGPTKKGACKGHKGVKEWYADEKAPEAAAAPKATPPSSTPAAPTAAPQPSPAAPAAAAKPQPPAPSKTAAAGGGAGKVWVNKSTKVYHCEGDQWYGKTKEGEYMTESDATAQGFKPSHGKACKK